MYLTMKVLKIKSTLVLSTYHTLSANLFMLPLEDLLPFSYDMCNKEKNMKVDSTYLSLEELNLLSYWNVMFITSMKPNYIYKVGSYSQK